MRRVILHNAGNWGAKPTSSVDANSLAKCPHALRMNLRQALGPTGVARVSTVLAAGVSPSRIRLGIARGEARRIRKGWLATPDAPAQVVRSVSLGGRVACVSAAQHHGLWTPPHDELHLGRPRRAGRTFADATGVVEHWMSPSWTAAEDPVESVEVLIRQVLLCCEREEAITIIDSALNKRMLTTSRLTRVVKKLPPRFATVLAEVDSASESGLESLCRVRLQNLSASIRSQVTIDGVGRVDLLIGGRLVLETDGRTWHEGGAAFHVDRTRDLTLHRLGYVVIRVSYAHVMDEWMLVELAIRAIVGRGEHLWSAAHRREGLAL